MCQCYGDLPPLQKDKAKEFKEPVIYSPMLTQTDMNISVNNKLYDFLWSSSIVLSWTFTLYYSMLLSV
jgi:hypothetical protein